MKEKINLVLASDDNYGQHAAITIMSAYDRCCDKNNLQAWILDGGISNIKKEKIIRSVEKVQGKVNFLEMDLSKYEGLFINWQYTNAIYYRLELPNVLAKDIKKCIYVDCDLLFFDDISKLNAVDLQGHPIGAIEDIGLTTSIKGRKEKAQSIGLEADDLYFNSGVIVMDLDSWRKNNYVEQAFSLAKSNDFVSHDQDVLNKLFLRNWQPLNWRWNVTPPISYLYPKILFNSAIREKALRARKKPGILHYAGRYKAWEFKRYEHFNDYYYELFSKSAFLETEMPQLSKQNIGRNFTKELFRMYLADCLTKIL